MPSKLLLFVLVRTMAEIKTDKQSLQLEQVKRIELSYPARRAGVLPLNYTCILTEAVPMVNIAPVSSET